MNPEIKIFHDKNTLGKESAEFVSGLIDKSIKERHRCTFNISGGSTPGALYRTLASQPYKNNINWKKVYIFWGDERCVPPDHKDSNYRMAKELLLDHIAIPSENIYRIPAEKVPADAAYEYETMLGKFFGEGGIGPQFDIILLGIGDDGHTASLFPGTSSIGEKERWVTEVYVPKFKSYRVTLTFPVINKARNVIFLVAGSSKAGILQKIVNDGDASYPASQVKPDSGKLIYLLDSDAGRNIKKK